MIEIVKNFSKKLYLTILRRRFSGRSPRLPRPFVGGVLVAGRRRGIAVVPLLSGLQPKLRLEPGAASLLARLPLLLLLLVDLPLSGAEAPSCGAAVVTALLLCRRSGAASWWRRLFGEICARHARACRLVAVLG